MYYQNNNKVVKTICHNILKERILKSNSTLASEKKKNLYSRVIFAISKIAIMSHTLSILYLKMRKCRIARFVFTLQ